MQLLSFGSLIKGKQNDAQTFLFPRYAPRAATQVRIDSSALEIFWEVVDALQADQGPWAQLWKRFSNHPAYAQIQKLGNRVSFFKKVLPIVFQPAKAKELKVLMGGPESPSFSGYAPGESPQ